MALVEPRRTKIVATIGPASSSKATIEALVKAGMDGARLNFSHGTREQHAEWARLVREVQEEVRRPLALIADLQGPKLQDRRPRARRSRSSAARRSSSPAASRRPTAILPVSPAVIGEVLRPGHEVLIDDGHVRLLVRERRAGPRDLHGDRRRRGDRAQGRQPAGRPGPDPGAHAQGHGRPRVRARARRRLRRALVRPLGRRRPRPARTDLAGRLARARDREDREVGGRRRARRDPPGDGRGHGRARRPRRRDRPGVGAAAPEADHPALRSNAGSP